MTDPRPTVGTPARPAELLAHLASLGTHTVATLTREDDWLVAPTTLRMPPMSWREMPDLIELECPDDALDESWTGAAVVLSYTVAGQGWHWRTVVRELAPRLKVDPPRAVCPGPPPSPGTHLIAVAPMNTTQREVRQWRVRSCPEPEVDQAFARLSGADLKLRSRRGQTTNHPPLVEDLLYRLTLADEVLVTRPEGHQLHRAVLEMFQLGLARPGIRVKPLGAALPLTTGQTFHVTGLSKEAIITARLSVERHDGDDLLCPLPKEVTRQQRRLNPRFALGLYGVKITLKDHHGRGWVVERLGDISLGGLRLQFNAAPTLEPGHDARVLIQLTDRHQVELSGVCVWRSDTGVGVRFFALDNTQIRMVRRLIEKTGRPR